MTSLVSDTREGSRSSTGLRISAAGDLHCHGGEDDPALRTLADGAQDSDLVLLAGDLTTHGEPAQVAGLARACAELDPPVVTVLGNHDHHADRATELAGALAAEGVHVLERSWARLCVAGVEVGVAGTKGFVGGFPGSHLPDFGEPLLRRVYRETAEEAEALEQGLVAIAPCQVRIVLLHYSPTTETLLGEPEQIWTYLGCDRLADPIARHAPDLVLHGHAHAGSGRGRIGQTPVFNVSLPVLEGGFWKFELEVPQAAAQP
jgi:Icc-related predicted phosphoesterase